MIGPYGSGENAKGTLRHLSKEEAVELGLLSDEYQSCLIDDQFEKFLERMEQGMTD